MDCTFKPDTEFVRVPELDHLFGFLPPYVRDTCRQSGGVVAGGAALSLAWVHFGLSNRSHACGSDYDIWVQRRYALAALMPESPFCLDLAGVIGKYHTWTPEQLDYLFPQLSRENAGDGGDWTIDGPYTAPDEYSGSYIRGAEKDMTIVRNRAPFRDEIQIIMLDLDHPAAKFDAEALMIEIGPHGVWATAAAMRHLHAARMGWIPDRVTNVRRIAKYASRLYASALLDKVLDDLRADADQLDAEARHGAKLVARHASAVADAAGYAGMAAAPHQDMFAAGQAIERLKAVRRILERVEQIARTHDAARRLLERAVRETVTSVVWGGFGRPL